MSTDPLKDVLPATLVEERPGDEFVVPEAPVADAARDSALVRRARTVSALVAVGLTALVAVLAAGVFANRVHPWFQPFDDSWNHWWVTHRVAPLTWVAKAMSVVGSSWVTFPIRLAVVLLLVLRRRWTQLAAFLSAVVASEVLITVLKSWVDRPRPLDSLVHTTQASFPSGHAIAAAVTAFGVVVAFVPRGRRRYFWIGIASFVAASMAWSRTYLSAHWATDTIAGSALGAALALFCGAAFEGVRRKVALSTTADPGPPAESHAG